ncbi:hypothetical protein AAG612_01380 [Citromicrobium bathyomarinum]|uniref:hypothetical protein n=1 Tax=Citromicrobium bathyomarinum TaxID=72174 RepID=UPI00315AB81F
MEREADVSGILSQTIETVGAAGRSVIVYVLVLGLLSGFGALFGFVSMDDNLFSMRLFEGGFDTETVGMLGALFGLANLAVFVIASYFLLTQMMAAMGRPMHAGARFWSFVGLSILAAIGVMIGFVFLVIPGIIVMVRWSAANGYLLSGEHGVTGSLGASWKATDGHGLSIFGAGLLIWIGLAVLSSGVVMGVGISGSGNMLSPMFALAITLSSIVESFSNAVSFAFSIAVFHLLAPTDTSVADVFE